MEPSSAQRIPSLRFAYYSNRWPSNRTTWQDTSLLKSETLESGSMPRPESPRDTAPSNWQEVINSLQKSEASASASAQL